jgi:hypothetical protein
MERRIFGLENEYGVTCTLRGQRRLSPDEVARYLFRRVVSWGRSATSSSRTAPASTSTSAATPSTPPRVRLDLDLVVHDKAGERILEGLVRAPSSACAKRASAARSTCSRTTPTRRQLLRLPRELPRRARRRLLQVHRRADPVPRHPPDLRGAGKVLQTARGAMYCISQRAEHIWEGVSSATTRQPADHQHPRRAARRRRALPPAARDRRRLQHERVHDVPQGRRDVDHAAHARGPAPWRDLTLENPIRAIREISHDITCRRAGPPRQRPRAQRARDPARVPQPGAAVRQAPRPPAARAAGARDVGARDDPPRDDPLKLDHRGRLGDQAPPDRGVPRRGTTCRSRTRASRCSTSRTTTSPVAFALLPARSARRQVERIVDRRRDHRGDEHAAADHPGRLRGAFIKRAKDASATTPSTGCT